MTDRPAVDVVIPTWNCGLWIDCCLRAIGGQTLKPARVIVVDDGSTDGTSRVLAGWGSRIELVKLERRRGFAHAVTRGMALSDAPWIALLNADTEADPKWLERLVDALSRAGAGFGSAASRMLQLTEPETIDNAGDTFSRFGSAIKRGRGEDADDWMTSEPVLSASAGAVLYRRVVLDELGGFDLDYDSYLEDVDLGLRAQLAGYQCLYVPDAVVLHAGGGSGLARAHYVRLITANRAATILKNFPGRLLLKHLPALAWGQIYFLIASRRPWQSFRGYLDLFRRLASILRERRRIQGSRRLAAAEFDRKLSRRLGEPPLGKLLRRKVGAE